jgi:hypothetical protein
MIRFGRPNPNLENRGERSAKSLLKIVFCSAFPAMFRLVILIAGLLWASLLLISWSGPVEAPQETTQIQTALLQDQN